MKPVAAPAPAPITAPAGILRPPVTAPTAAPAPAPIAAPLRVRCSVEFMLLQPASPTASAAATRIGILVIAGPSDGTIARNRNIGCAAAAGQRSTVTNAWFRHILTRRASDG